MALRLHIEEGILENQEVIFWIKDLKGLQNIKPAGRMIIDPVDNRFVYLIDGETVFHQLHFSQHTWPLLESALQLGRDPYIKVGDETIQLSQFVEELSMCLDHIQDNDNYGAAFVQAVESVFANVLQVAE